MSKVERFRNWSFIGYPGDSLPENYRDILDEEHITWAESPVHDKDVNADGEAKKPHIHFLLCFEGVKTLDQIKEITAKVNGTNPIKVQSVRGMVRYFVHFDNPEKHQYDRSSIISHGIDIDQYFETSMQAKKIICAQMIDWCEDNCCCELSVLLKAAKEFHYQDWYDLLICGGGLYIMDRYLTSKRNGKKLKKEDVEDYCED